MYIDHDCRRVRDLRVAFLDVLRLPHWSDEQKRQQKELTPKMVSALSPAKCVLDDLASEPLAAVTLGNDPTLLIDEWARRHRLGSREETVYTTNPTTSRRLPGARWLVGTAADTLESWAKYPTELKHRVWNYAWSSMIPDEEGETLRFATQGWSPERESRGDAEKRLTAEILLQIRVHLDRVEAQLPESDRQLTRPRLDKRRRKREMLSPVQRAALVVRHLILEEPYRRLAPEVGLTRTGVQMSVTGFLEQIEIAAI